MYVAITSYVQMTSGQFDIYAVQWLTHTVKALSKPSPASAAES